MHSLLFKHQNLKGKSHENTSIEEFARNKQKLNLNKNCFEKNVDLKVH